MRKIIMTFKPLAYRLLYIVEFLHRIYFQDSFIDNVLITMFTLKARKFATNYLDKLSSQILVYRKRTTDDKTISSSILGVERKKITFIYLWLRIRSFPPDSYNAT